MNEIGKTNDLLRYVKTMDKDKGFNKLEELISEYVSADGKELGAVVLQEKDINEWKKTLDIYWKISEILFNLESNFDKEECQELGNYFQLKNIERYLTSVVIRGSGLFKAVEEKEKVRINRTKMLKEERVFKEEDFKTIEEFINEPMPHQAISNELTVESLNQLDDKSNAIFEKGEKAYWYLLYYSAFIHREKEVFDEGKMPQELIKAEQRIKGMMYRFVQQSKNRNMNFEHSR